MSLLGQRLRQAREARGISPLQIEIDTRIRANVIQALEDGAYASLPPGPFLRGLIRSYATYLRVDPQEMLDLYAADVAPPPPPPDASARPGFPLPLKSILPRDAASQPSPPSVTKPSPIPHTPAARPSGLDVSPSLSRSSSESVAPPPPSVLPEPIAPPPPRTPVPAPTTTRAMPIPSTPPETLGQPETMAPPISLPSLVAGLTPPAIPRSALILLGAAIIFAMLACGLFAFAQLAPRLASLTAMQRTATPTRALPTATPTRGLPTATATFAPGAAPTPIPTLAVTAPPFATLPVSPSATPRTTPPRPSETTGGLNLDIDATQAIAVQVGIDGVLVFSGEMAPGTSRSWSARESLYVRVENSKDAAIFFNGKAVLPRVFAERTLMERQWVLNPKGTPVSAPPLAPAAAPTAPPPATPPGTAPTPGLTPTPTLTPFS